MQSLINKLRMPTEQVLLEKLSSLASQEILIFFFFLVYYCFWKNPTFVRIMNQMKITYAFSFYLFKIRFNIILPPTSRPSKVSLCFRCPHVHFLCPSVVIRALFILFSSTWSPNQRISSFPKPYKIFHTKLIYYCFPSSMQAVSSIRILRTAILYRRE
jgi:hypothetical protein